MARACLKAISGSALLTTASGLVLAAEAIFSGVSAFGAAVFAANSLGFGPFGFGTFGFGTSC